MLQAASPDNTIRISLSLNDNGTLLWSVSKDGAVLLPPAALGLKTSVGDFTAGLTFVSSSERLVDETYEVTCGKRKVCRSYGRELSAAFTKDGVDFTVTVRAANDGAAFRYGIAAHEDFEITEEATHFLLPADAPVWCNDKYAEWYEFNYRKYTAATLNDDEPGKILQMPFLTRVDGVWMQISESNLSDAYCGLTYVSEADGAQVVFSSRFAATQQGSVQVAANFVSPWRTVIAGGLDTVLESTLITDLADPCTDGRDYSFVKPGATAWSWLDGDRPHGADYSAWQTDTAVFKRFIDLAADMGWQYYIMDEGWQPKNEGDRALDGRYLGYPDHFPEWRDYAREKGIGLFAWCDSSDLNTPRKRERLAEWKRDGIVGIKVDFFNEENQATLRLYNDIYAACADVGLMVVAHGANKSVGEERTYPNVLNKEGIYGQEQGSVTPANSVCAAFTRYAVGNTDFTEYLLPREANVTAGFQLGMSAVYTGGVHCFADGVSQYRTAPQAELLKHFPPYFDETRFLDGTPDDFVMIARRFGADWYVGGIANGDVRRTLALDFLPDGAYDLVLYDDTDDYRTLARTASRVTKADRVAVHMAANGGFLMKLTHA